MGFLKRLFGFGATVAGTVAAVKVTDKVKENNPGGVQDVNGDGKVDYKDYAIEAKRPPRRSTPRSGRRPPAWWPRPRRRGPSSIRTPRRP